MRAPMEFLAPSFGTAKPRMFRAFSPQAELCTLNKHTNLSAQKATSQCFRSIGKAAADTFHQRGPETAGRRKVNRDQELRRGVQVTSVTHLKGDSANGDREPSMFHATVTSLRSLYLPSVTGTK